MNVQHVVLKVLNNPTDLRVQSQIHQAGVSSLCCCCRCRRPLPCFESEWQRQAGVDFLAAPNRLRWPLS
jgi:hypothetical protein